MQETYHVRVSKEAMVFSAAHFLTFNGDQIERLHGHNYTVAAEVFGQLDENHYVIDFIALRDTLQKIAQRLDHYTLLPLKHPLIKVVATEEEVEVTFREKRWIFPRGDCVLLPIANTTAELIARYIGLQLRDALQKRTGVLPALMRIEVDERFGQLAVCELRSEPLGETQEIPFGIH